MKENFKNFIKRARANNLSENDKNVLRSKILEFISFNPIRGKTPIVRDRNYISIFEVRYFMKAASLALICVLVVGGSGISYAAAKSLPGDALYSVKVNINEGIEETLATTPKAKLAVQSEHIQRRLDEAQKLRKEQKLSPETQKIVADKIGEHTASAIQSMSALKEKGDVATVLETTAKLTPVLEANREILSTQEKNNDSEGNPEDTTSILAVVDDSIKSVQEQENQIIASVDLEEEPTTITMMSMTAEQPLAKSAPTPEEIATKKAITEVKALGKQITEIVEDRIHDAKDKLQNIKESVRSEEETQAKIDATEEVEEKESEIPTTTPASLNTSDKLGVQAELNSKTSVAVSEKNIHTTKVASEVKVETLSDFEVIYEQIKVAEEILGKAEKLLRDKDLRGALTLAQQANKIAEQIEAGRRLKALELSKNNMPEVSQKASVSEGVNLE